MPSILRGVFLNSRAWNKSGPVNFSPIGSDMLHSIPPDQHGPFSGPMTHAVESCVHCGFCLAACPTYRELGQEMDTPRGRIVLMKQVFEGTLTWAEAQPHIDRCLGCLACEPACPSGVPYRDLISPFRALAEPHFPRSAAQKFRRFLALQTLPYPNRLRLAASLGQALRPFARLCPTALRPMLDLLPRSLPRQERSPALIPPRPPSRPGGLAPGMRAAGAGATNQRGYHCRPGAKRGRVLFLKSRAAVVRWRGIRVISRTPKPRRAGTSEPSRRTSTRS